MTSPLFGNTSAPANPTLVKEKEPDVIDFSALQATPVTSGAIAPISAEANVVPSASKERSIEILRNTIPAQYLENVGSAHSSALAQVSTQILSHVTSSDLGSFGDRLGEVIVLTKGLSPEQFRQQKGFFGKIRGMLGNAKERMLQEFNSVSTQLDRLVAEIGSHKQQQDRAIDVLEKMYAANYEEYQKLNAEIDQAIKVIDQREAQLATIDSGVLDPMEVQIYADEKNKVARLKQRVHELTASLRVAEQTAPEIRQFQDNSRKLVEKFQIVQTIGIPIWKKQFSLAVMNMDQERSANVIKEFEDMTNEIMVKNAQMLKTNSVAIANLTAQTMVKAETVEQVNTLLIEMLTETQQITSQSDQTNKEAAKRMKASNDKLLETMRKTS